MNGIGGKSTMTRKLQAYILPWFQSDYRLYTELFVSSEFGGLQPWVSLSSIKPESNEFTLADPNFDQPAPVDILLSCDVWSEIVGNLTYRHVDGPIMHETILGHVILGKVFLPIEAFQAGIYQAAILPEQEQALEKDSMPEQALDILIKQFFAIEDVPEIESQRTKGDNAVEQMYKETVRRKQDGSYIVRIPFKSGKALGESRKIVMRRFFTLEKKLQANPVLRTKYIKFMREFIQLGHMREAPPIKPDTVINYIPHHSINADKFRSVFDASCRTSNGQSLNSIQLIGPKLQLDIHYHLMRFRRFRYAVVTDVVKMFRQVSIDQSQWDLQRIFWREAPDQPLREYQITVVIYGLAASLYLAVRSMIQCAEDYGKEYPEAAEIIRRSFYVDDGSFGADSIAALKLLCKEVEFVLGQGGFKLGKWVSNSATVEKHMQFETNEDVELGRSESEAKILGLRWMKETDEIAIVVKQIEANVNDTKRKIVSGIMKLFDPNGFVAPVIVVAKMIMRDIWKHKKLSWDKAVPVDIGQRWVEFVDGLNKLNEYRIPRWLSIYKQSKVQLHGFCDAIKYCIGAAVYTRVTCGERGVACTSLLVAKSKVSSEERTITRMELLAALLLSKLMTQAAQACEFEDAEKFYWSDSTVALYWIKRSPLELKQFVGNRVQAIQEYTRGSTWSHISGKTNPADPISRGMKLDDFVKSEVWKNGPDWLSKKQSDWPKPILSFTPQEKVEISREVKPKVNLILSTRMTNVVDQFRELWYRSNDWKKILRITVYVLRFIANLRMKDRMKWIKHEPKPDEIKNAIIFWVKYAQLRAFKQEEQALKQANPAAAKKSKIMALQPIFDKAGVMRIGGRISKANAEWTKNHPIIIPPRSRLSYLLIQDAHQETLHGSIQIMMAYIRQSYWIPQLRSECRTIISQCARCARYAKKTAKQIMAELPAVRIRPARPFNAVGIDLAGPFNVKLTDKINLSTRSKASIPEIKGYIAVFVCMVTRAVHLEAVMDLTGEAFLQAYKRFVARRGNPEKVFSDNGTNLVAADNILRNAVETWQGAEIQNFMHWNGSSWSFITPGAPHEGGLWEAAVKAMKHHLRRVIGVQKYSYEGISTLIACIEACLNSRPLCALSDDPNDTEALTPAHFLIGGPLKLPLPERCDTPPRMAKSLYKAIQAQTQAFWETWSNDCLHAMMNRPKWREAQQNLKQGQLVLIKNENLPPTYWAMGRIIEVNAARDDKVRSVKLQMQNGILERSIRKLCVLPTDEISDFWVENK
ncbi:uncharacterized protein LOC129565314 isoform X1 [Sitodiplosis mosellana]|uniref:uncharacterized protein LOC129565314 isoform X1 n=1 Tax=Sitodiplosis mosellana TaxID=263140 RepID=UPI0024444124|nr:uncharacterized protein LOC129565314 isoform X1 [Sitodiplosis mosellana]